MLKIKPKEPKIELHTRFGLANRILSVASMLRIAKILNKQLAVFWPLNWDIGMAKFNELFDCDKVKICTPTMKPIKSEFIPKRMIHEEFAVLYHSEVYMEGDDPKTIDLLPYFAALVPVQDVKEEVNEFVNNHHLETMVGVHIRKGDKRLNSQSNSYIENLDEKYIKVMKGMVEKLPRTQFFICTDEKIEKYSNAFQGRIIQREKKHNPLKRELWSIREALIDLILLSKTKTIIYGLGTFGYCAGRMSQSKAINIITGLDSFTLHTYSYARPKSAEEILKVLLRGTSRIM